MKTSFLLPPPPPQPSTEAACDRGKLQRQLESGDGDKGSVQVGPSIQIKPWRVWHQDEIACQPRSTTDRRLVIQSPDLMSSSLAVATREVWTAKNCGLALAWRIDTVWFQCMTSPMLWLKLRSFPSGFHAITGSDLTSYLADIGKKKVWDSFCCCTDHQDSLSLLGEEQELNVTTPGKCEAYVCSVYTASETSTANEPRFSPQKKQRTKCFHPDVWLSDATSKVVKLPGIHVEAYHALEAMQDLESPEGHGWVRDRELLIPLLISKEPESLLELTTCKCKTSACWRNCSCNNTGLACSEGCYCMPDNEACKNPHGLTCIIDSEESEEEWRGAWTMK